MTECLSGHDEVVEAKRYDVILKMLVPFRYEKFVCDEYAAVTAVPSPVPTTTVTAYPSPQMPLTPSLLVFALAFYALSIGAIKLTMRRQARLADERFGKGNWRFK